MTDFLLELLSEEIPARMQDGARAELGKLFAAQMAAAGLPAEDVTIWSTPRRLALIARGLPLETAAVAEEFKGPRTSAPPQALEGFLRKTGLTQDQLEDRDGVWFATITRPGKSTSRVLTDTIAHIVRHMPWPKSMRWGKQSNISESSRWVRPLSGIVSIFGEELVPCRIAGVEAGVATKGHRFHSSGDITIGGAHDYAEKLRDAHVIVDQDERRAIIRERAQALCAERGLTWIADEALVAENAGLTEWPVPLLGDFDPAFLEVPPEVVRLTLATNQKYFVAANPLRHGEVARSDGGGSPPPTELEDDSPLRPLRGHLPASGEDFSLAPAFICTANIEASDGGAAIVAGNRKVLAARLSDARFFWEQDKKTPLAVHAEKLSRITFHEKLGTVADKVERVAKLARWLVEEGIFGSSPERGGGREADGGGSPPQAMLDNESPLRPLRGHLPASGEDRAQLADLAETAARLCKADLVTEMVGEFPELQGVMGGYYARAEGLPEAVADAIRDHYKPVGQGDAVPTAPVTVAVSLADKLDTLVGFFAAEMPPTGSKDPFALRRAALGIIDIIITNKVRLPLGKTVRVAAEPVLAARSGVAFVERLMQEVDAGRLGKDEVADFTKKGISDLVSDQGIKKVVEQSGWASQLLLDFLADRLKVQQREAGVRHDLIDAVFALGGEDDLVRLLARVKALQAFVGTADGVNLLAGYKRAANILKKEGGAAAPLPLAGGAGGGPADQAVAPADSPTPNPSRKREGDYLPEPAEAALIAALDVAEPAAAAAVAEERFEEAMAALASLRAPIDAFFESVTVNDADQDKRAARLALLARLTAAVEGIADFSKIEG